MGPATEGLQSIGIGHALSPRRPARPEVELAGDREQDSHHERASQTGSTQSFKGLSVSGKYRVKAGHE
jgi:hypothetical protein